MKITALLAGPTLGQIEKQLQGLASEIPQSKDILNQNQALLAKVCGLLSDLDILKKEISNVAEGEIVPASIYTELRRIKRAAQFSGRTFLKLKSNEARYEKMAARRNDVSTVAA